ncbi:MAG: hypothetical protein WAM14_04180 [Candidatus Nitrosopolaris sp.]
MSQTLIKLTNLLTPNQKKFIAEVIGTFIVVVLNGLKIRELIVENALTIRPLPIIAAIIGGSAASNQSL